MEDQEVFDQYLEHRQQHQNYVIDNMSAVAGCGDGGSCSGDILGAKFDEQLQSEPHDVGDDDELKYVKEVQQSEKHQTSGEYNNTNELAENEQATATYSYETGNGGTITMEGLKDITESLDSYSNGHEKNKSEDQEMGVVNTHSPNLIASVSAEKNHAYSFEQKEVGDDEEASSLLSNGTSSLSENVAQIPADDLDMLTSQSEQQTCLSKFSLQQAAEGHIELALSQLNPEAKEFVPTIASPTSPISPEPNNSHLDEEFYGQPASAVPRRIISDDDFVAQSPRKGGCGNMDAISLPPEQEFDEEADQRPHELTQDNMDPFDMGPVGNVESIDNTNKDCYSINEVNVPINTENTNLIDHGPETCVDLDVDISKLKCDDLPVTDNDVMKQSIYISSSDPIEDVLNSVQPIPTEIDSVNNSFIEDSHACIGDKEQLQIEEKEHVSNSPSTEEMDLHDVTDNTNLAKTMPCDATVEPESFYIESNQTGGQNTLQDGCQVESLETKYDDVLATVSNSVNENNDKKEIFGTLAFEKHLMEDTKEQHGADSKSLEQLMNQVSLNVEDIVTAKDNTYDSEKINSTTEGADMLEQLNNMTLHTDDHFSQVEEVTTLHDGTVIEKDSICEKSFANNICQEKETEQVVENTQVQPVKDIVEHHTGSEDIGQILGNVRQDSENSTLVEAVVNSEIITNSEICKSEEKELEFLGSNSSMNIVTDEIPIMNFEQQLGNSLNEATKSPIEAIAAKLENNMGLVENAFVAEESAFVVESMPTKHENSDIELVENTLDINVESIVVNTMNDKMCTTLLENITNNTVETQKDIANVDEVANNTAGGIIEQNEVSIKNQEILNSKKPDNIKKTAAKNTTSTVKPKVSSISATSKKAAISEPTKRVIGITAKPKPAPSKTLATTGTTEKKLTKPTSASVTSARKPVPQPVNKVAPKSSTSTASRSTAQTKTVPSKPIAPARTVSSASTVARKPTSSASSGVSKPRPTSTNTSVTSKPTLGLPSSVNGAVKTKATSPRALSSTSQIRQTPTSTSSVKSPVKPATTNIQAKSTASTSRPKAPNDTTSVTTSTKPFTARPAPKFTTTTTTTSRRLTVGGTTTSQSTSKLTITSTSQRKSSPIKTTMNKTPTKPPNSNITAKNTKSITKETPTKPSDKKLNGTVPSADLAAGEAQAHPLENSVPKMDEKRVFDQDGNSGIQIDLSIA
ncbi:microtubule-associated protein 205 [Haematobia irritans]|uniref:microtubule-associated protein 205 n=1 Tax=Haematobia irritans TaxID=7368 RepID=UPI003F4FAFB0